MNERAAGQGRRRFRHLGLTVVSAATSLLLMAGPAGASLLDGVRDNARVNADTGSADLSTPVVENISSSVASDAAPGTENIVATVIPSETGGDEGGKAYEAEAEGSSVTVKLFGQEIVSVGNTQSGAGEEGASGDATVLSVLGHEIIGTHSESEGEGSSSSVTGYAHETCTFGVEGLIDPGTVCLGILYGYSESESGKNGSSNQSHTAVASACVGGDQSDPHEECGDDAIVDAGVGESDSSAEHRKGRSKATRSSGLARVCVGGRNDKGDCKIAGAELMQKEESAEGSGKHDEGRTDSSVDVLGEERLSHEHPHEFPEDCATDEDDNCAAANEGSVSASDGDPSDGDDDDGVTVKTGSASASAEGGVVRVNVLGNEVLRAGSSSSSTGENGASGDATVLSVLGHEIIGAHAESEGNGKSESETGYGTETCEATDGALCVTLLYARAESESKESSSKDGDGTERREEEQEAHSDTYGASVCLGGEQRDPNEPCDGPVGATAGESHSDASQRTSGEKGRDDEGNEYHKSEAESESRNENDGATVCLGGENKDDACEGLGVNVLHSENESSARSDGESKNKGNGYVVCVEAEGECQLTLDQPTTLPPGCEDGSDPACIRLNDSESGAGAEGDEGTGGSNTVVALDVLPNEDGEGQASGRAGESGSDASAEGETRVLGTRFRDEDPPPAGSGPGPGPAVLGAPDTDPQSRRLPATGVQVLSFLLTAGLLVGSGTALVRRRSKRS